MIWVGLLVETDRGLGEPVGPGYRRLTMRGMRFAEMRVRGGVVLENEEGLSFTIGSRGILLGAACYHSEDAAHPCLTNLDHRGRLVVFPGDTVEIAPGTWRIRTKEHDGAWDPDLDPDVIRDSVP
jgi:hypothetical protein